MIDPVEHVEYVYDEVGNRQQMIADGEVTDYTYDEANRLLQAGDTTFTYDANGNMIEKTDENGTVSFTYTTDNKLKGVYYPDETSVEFAYDALRRKISRTQSYYDIKDLEDLTNSKNQDNGNGNTKANGKGKPVNPGIKGKTNAITRGNGEKTGLLKQMDDLLQTETTNYLYDGMRVLSEYNEKGAPLAEYYTANGQVLAKQMFGFHGRKQEGYEGNIQTRGGLMYYQQDALGNVMDITDRIGDVSMKYRYDAFGNLFTQMAAPYNAVGFTGKTYDAKASLMDFSARWYSPNVGRFTTEDTFFGWMQEPLSLNRYNYVHSNPVNYIDPTGHWQEGDENLPQEDQERIRDLTDEYYSTDDADERQRIHDEAEAIKNQNDDSGDDEDDDDDSYSGRTWTKQEWIQFRDAYFGNQAGEMPAGFTYVNRTFSFNLDKQEYYGNPWFLQNRFKLEGSLDFKLTVKGKVSNYYLSSDGSLSFTTKDGNQISVDNNGNLIISLPGFSKNYSQYKDIAANVSLKPSVGYMDENYIKIAEGEFSLNDELILKDLNLKYELTQSLRIGVKNYDFKTNVTAASFSPVYTDSGRILYPKFDIPHYGTMEIPVPINNDGVLIIPPIEPTVPVKIPTIEPIKIPILRPIYAP